MNQNDIYRVLLDRDWELEDLYEFPHAYGQTYAFIYCLDSELNPKDAKRINRALNEYPWQGGYSYVNIYTVLKNQVPIQHRPRIHSIQYSSPGWLDLVLNPDVALQVAKSVGILLTAGVTAAEAYKKIYTTLSSIKTEQQKNNLNNAKLTQAQLKIVMGMSDDIAKHLGFNNVQELHERTGNPEVSLKILLAHYRRMKVLADFEANGKAILTNKDE